MNGTKAKCGHFVIAVGAPGSAARMNCENFPCEQCSAEETQAMSALLRAHPKHGQRAISINDCLRCRQVPRALKVAWELVYNRNYGKGTNAVAY